MYRLPIVSNSGSAHRISLVHITFHSSLQMFYNMLVSRGLKPPFLWVQMTLHCSSGDHIGVHSLIFSGLLVIYQIVTVFLFLWNELVP